MPTPSSPTFRRYLAKLISWVDKSGKHLSYTYVKSVLLNCWAGGTVKPEKAVNEAYQIIMRT